MQVSDAEYQGRIELSSEQLQAALPAGPQNPLDWFPGHGSESVHRALLLMHHPPEWLSRQSLATFNQSIYHPERFALLLHGHMHEGRSVTTSISGGRPRHSFQAPSLFGLEHYGTKKESRSFGYAFGRITAAGEVRIWPWKMADRGDGTQALDQDQSFEGRDSDGSFLLRSADATPSPEATPSASCTASSTPVAAADPLDPPTLQRFREWSLGVHTKLRLIGVGANDYPFSIDKIYVPLRVSAQARCLELDGNKTALQRRRKPEPDDRIELDQAFERAEGLDLLLLGEPGAGKTTALMKLLHQMFTDGPESVGLPSGTLPLMLRLRSIDIALLQAPELLYSLLERELETTSAGAWGPDLARMLWNRGRLLLLLDGLDEVADPGLRAEACTKISRALAVLRGRQIRAVVTCRYSEFGREMSHEGELFALDLRPLEDAQITSLLEHWFAEARATLEPNQSQRAAARIRGAEEAREVAAKLNDHGNVDPGLLVLVTTPLFLTLLAVVALRKGELPPRRVDFFVRYLVALGAAAEGGAAIEELARHFGNPWWTEVVLLAVALPQYRVFDGLIRVLVRTDALPEQGELLVRAVREAHQMSSAPFFYTLKSEEEPAPKRAAILRALLDRADGELVEVAKGLRSHPDVDLRAPASRLVELEERSTVTAEGTVRLPKAGVQGTLTSRGVVATIENVALVLPYGIRLLKVPGGRFQMGAEDISDYERPVHWVQMSPFWLAETPVTNAQYKEFVRQGGRRSPQYADDRRFGRPEQPVVGISWRDAVAFCKWLSGVSKESVVLPSEAQWEFAARGTEGRKYSWGNEDPDATRARYGQSIEYGPADVGTFPAGRGPFGHQDLAGNIWEWCRDMWDDEAYAKRVASKGALVDPRVRGMGSHRCLRGGAFCVVARFLRSACRDRLGAEDRYQSIGFRVAVFPASRDS